MHAPSSIQITPVTINSNSSKEVTELKMKLNEVINKLDSAYRLLWADVKQMDFRELPPNPNISHSKWKWVEDSATGDLVLYYNNSGTWEQTGYRYTGVV